jgi:hypothetical protein
MALQSNSDLPFLNELFDLSFQFVILHSLTYVFTQFHHLFLVFPLVDFPWGLLLNTWLTFLFLSVLLTRPIQFNPVILTNEGTSKYSNSYINYLFYLLIQFSFTLIPPNIRLKTTTHLAISSVNILLHTLPDTSLVNVLQIYSIYRYVLMTYEDLPESSAHAHTHTHRGSCSKLPYL